MNKIQLVKGLVAAGSALTLVLVAGTPVISILADSENGNAAAMPVTANILQVDASGQALLRGTIDSISASSLMIKSWGGDWTVNVGASATILPTAVGRDLTQFKTGDFVGVQGMVSPTANLTIDAMVVRDRTAEQALTQERQQNIETERETKNLGPMNFQGTESGLNGSTFTLTALGGTVYTVNVASGAQVVNQARLTIPLSNIQNGDTVRVWGTNASGTITAQIVRDISIGGPTPTNQSGHN